MTSKKIVVMGQPRKPVDTLMKQVFKCKNCKFRNVCSVLYMDESIGCEKYKLKLEK